MRNAGFTLLEMLVAVALFSLLLLGFGSVFYRLERTERALSRVEWAEEVEVVRQFVRQSLEGARPIMSSDAQGNRRIRFEGAPDRLRFAEVADGTRLVGGLYQTEIRLDEQGQLVLMKRPIGWGSEFAVASAVLLRGVASAEFSYSSCPSAPPERNIHRWTLSDRLPFGVSLSLTFKDGDRRQWPDLSVLIPAANCPAGRWDSKAAVPPRR